MNQKKNKEYHGKSFNIFHTCIFMACVWTNLEIKVNKSLPEIMRLNEINLIILNINIIFIPHKFSQKPYTGKHTVKALKADLYRKSSLCPVNKKEFKKIHIKSLKSQIKIIYIFYLNCKQLSLSSQRKQEKLK